MKNDRCKTERQVIQELTRYLKKPLSPEQVGQGIADIAGTAFGESISVLLYLDDMRQNTLSAASHGSIPDGADFTRLSFTHFPSQVLAQNEPVRIDGSEPWHGEAMTRLHPLSQCRDALVLAPLRWNNILLALLAVIPNDATTLSPENIALLKTVTDLGGAALGHAISHRTFQKTERILIEAQRIAQIGSWEWDLIDETFFWTDEVFHLFGLSPHEVTPSLELFEQFVHPDDLARFKQTMENAIAKRKPYEIEFRFVRFDGFERYGHLQAKVVLNDLGRPTHAIGTLRDTTEHTLLQDQLERLSFNDGLTGIANRRHFDGVLDQEWKRAVRNANSIALILCDIDHFKTYNDTYGHQQGDECLIEVAQTLKSIITRATDLVARYGGEEFVAVLPETTLEGAFVVAENMRVAIEELEIPHAASPVSQHVTLSLGVASTIPSRIGSASQLVEAADRALYSAKNQGRNQVQTSKYKIGQQLMTRNDI